MSVRVRVHQDRLQWPGVSPSLVHQVEKKMRSNFPNLVDPFLKLTKEEVCESTRGAAHWPLGVLLCWVGRACGVPLLNAGTEQTIETACLQNDRGRYARSCQGRSCQPCYQVSLCKVTAGPSGVCRSLQKVTRATAHYCRLFKCLSEAKNTFHHLKQ